jgi:hypothetical protein
MGFWSLIAGIAIGVAGTAVVWVFKTYVVKPRLHMSPQISRKDDQGTPAWRVKIGNYSWLPAIDMSVRAVLRASIPGSGTTVIAVGLSSESIDFLPGRTLRKPGRHRLIYLDPAGLSPLAVGRLPEDLQSKIRHPEDPPGPIRLEDLLSLSANGTPATLTVSAFCFNGLSGTRKYFSRSYAGSAAVQSRPFRKGSLELAGSPAGKTQASSRRPPAAPRQPQARNQA